MLAHTLINGSTKYYNARSMQFTQVYNSFMNELIRLNVYSKRIVLWDTFGSGFNLVEDMNSFDFDINDPKVES